MTINGMTVTGAFEKLAAKSPVIKTSYDKFPYIPVETYEARMFEVFGAGHFNVNYTPVIKTEVQSRIGTQIFLSTVCSITLLDDEFHPIVTKECAGGVELLMTKESGRFDGLKNDITTACQHAYKNACKKFNIFNLAVADCDKPSGQAQQKHGSEKKDKQIYRLLSTDILERAANYTDEKPSFILPCTYEDKKVEVVFFSNFINKSGGKFNEFSARTLERKGIPFSIEGVEQTYKGVEQIVFNSFT